MDGRQIYEHICQGCHMADGGGAVGAGHYPALAKDPTLASRQYMALTLLVGRRNMPAFGAKHAIGFGGPPVTLSEAQIAAVTNYVRTQFRQSLHGFNHRGRSRRARPETPRTPAP